MSNKEIIKRVCATITVMLLIPIIIIAIISLIKILAQKLNTSAEDLLYIALGSLSAIIAVMTVATVLFALCYMCVDPIFTRIQLDYNYKKLLSLKLKYDDICVVDKERAKEISTDIEILKEYIRRIEYHENFL